MNSKNLLLFGTVFAAVFGALMYGLVGLPPESDTRKWLNGLINGEAGKHSSAAVESTAQGTGKSTGRVEPTAVKLPPFVKMPPTPPPPQIRRWAPSQRRLWENIMRNEGFTELRNGQNATAEKTFLKLLEDIEPYTQGDDEEMIPDLLSCLVSLGQAQMNQGPARYAEAEQHLKRAMNLADAQLKNKPIELAPIQVALSVLYQQQHRYTDAEPLLRKAVAAQQEALNKDDQTLVDELSNNVTSLGMMLYLERKYADAEPYLKDAVDLREKTAKLKPEDISQALVNLAALYQAQGKTVQAEPLLKRAVDIVGLLEYNQPVKVVAITNLAALYKKEGKDAEAETLFRRAIDLREKNQPIDHAAMARSQVNLAAVLINQGKYREAEQVVQTALDAQIRQNGAEHPDLLPALETQALLYRKTKRDAEAVTIDAKVQALKAKLTPPKPVEDKPNPPAGGQ